MLSIKMFACFCVCLLQGRHVASFEDHELWYPYNQDELFYLAGRQGLIISYCRVRSTSTWQMDACAVVPFSFESEAMFWNKSHRCAPSSL